jgi:gliding motility-associated-like protein
LGNTTGCPTFPTCLYVKDFWLETDTLLVTSFEVPSPDTTTSVTYPITASFSNFCDYPPVPVPNFSFPDTLCQGSSAASISDGNRLAQAREWHLTGPGVDSVLLDSFEFDYHFDMPGQYELQQSVWVLGCRYDYVRSVTVSPPLTASIVSDTIICPDQQMEIVAQANRAASFTWGSGHQAPSEAIIGSGTYAVTATDGHCQAMDSATVTVVSELLWNNPPFTLPHDTVSCLPYLLEPSSLFTDEFYLEGNSVAASNFTLTDAGSYRIHAEIFGCEFSAAYQLGIDCEVNLYLPNSFSPNGDGINDVFMPYGDDFEVLELAIYDRWGGLRSKGQIWDGGTAGQGVYLYKLRYKNLKSGKTEEVSGEVSLVK